jgi:S-DNA-T family DNA segregation ATPase FtsK/SpoIIIE
MLNFDAAGQNLVDKTAMLELSARLTQTLENYGVKGDVVAIRPGPVVTMYEFAPAPGTRVNKIVNLTDDLALALEALRVRIVAPIPGKAAVGIEVPNKIRDKVFLKEILADDVFRRGKARLPMALGKDIEGGPAVVDMARMPHLLVAGTTGSGKSVAVNAMITSLLYHCSPEDVRMIMVDPKMLELSIYEGVPHLLLPVVTDPKKANLALRWAVDEMDRRYDMLAKTGVRDIASYNEKALKTIAQFEADKLQRAANAAKRALARENGEAIDPNDHSDDVVVSSNTDDSARIMATEPPAKLPYIVVIIDEFADLMMCAPKEVETSVARIAQKARAAGIHLILATQRPSVDVITGLIKANFPSRIAFHVTSKIDSRTILDQTGAEALLGAGDMLFSDRGAAPQRLHGCYVDEEEIHRVVAFLKTQGRPVYNMEILKPREEEEGGEAGSGTPSGKSDDEMYDKAVHIVSTTGNASISWVQRQLRIGYNRAARLVEEMEKQGVVSGPDHTNKREVLIARS